MASILLGRKVSYSHEKTTNYVGTAYFDDLVLEAPYDKNIKKSNKIILVRG